MEDQREFQEEVLDFMGLGSCMPKEAWRLPSPQPLQNGLNRALGDEVRLSTTVLLDDPTSSALVDHVVGILFPGEVVSGHTMHRPAKADAVVITGMACPFPGK